MLVRLNHKGSHSEAVPDSFREAKPVGRDVAFMVKIYSQGVKGARRLRGAGPSWQ